MSKDRAAPFSRKHRRYWLPVTGGMLLIGGINIGLGLCSYENAPVPERLEVDLRSHDAGTVGALDVGRIPVTVMRAFAARYPQTIPAGAVVQGGDIVVLFRPGAPHARATFHLDGTFVSEQ